MTLRRIHIPIPSWQTLITYLIAMLILLLSLLLPGPIPARGAVNQVYLPNVTKTLGGQNGWTTPVVVQNVGSAASDIVLTFFRFSDGKQLTTITLPAVKPGQSVTVDPRNSASLPDDTQFSVVVQSANGQVAAVVLEGAGTTWMAYSGTTTGGSTVYLPNVTRNLGGRDGWNTPFIVQNLGTAPTVASVSFYNFTDGSLAKRIDNVSLEPGRSQAFLPWAIDGLADDGQYAVVVQGPASSQLFAVVNEQSGLSAMSYEGLLAGSEVVYLPSVVKYLGGPDHWSDPFIIQNLGATPATFTAEFYSLETGQLVTTLPGLLQPGRSLPVDVRFSPATLPPGSYSVVVRGQKGATLGAVVNESELSAGMAMSYDGIGQSQAQQSVYVPLLRKNVFQAAWSSTVVAQNLGTSATDITVTIYDAQGAIAGQKVLTAVKPGAAAVYDARSDRRLPNGTYSAILQAPNPITAIVNVTGIGAGDLAMAFAGTAGPQTQIPPFVAGTKQVGSSVLTVRQGIAADVWIENGIDPATASRALAQADIDAAAVQAEYGRQYTTIPQIYIFANEQTYASGMIFLLGAAPAVAADRAKRADAVFSAREQIVLANWAQIGPYQPWSAIRHELTHLMHAQIIGTNPTMPAWLDEGLAVNSELSLPGSQWLAMALRYRVASMAYTGTIIPLNELESPITWSQRSGAAATYEYAEGQQAAAMLRQDIGRDGIVRILSLMGEGRTFPEAYAAVAGRPYSLFVAEFTIRARTLASTFPGIATVTDSPIGPGLSWIYYGFAPNAQVTLEVRSNIAGNVYQEQVSPYGAMFGFAGPSFPAGVYNVNVTDGARTISVIANKL